MKLPNKHGEMIDEEIQGRREEGDNLYMVFWERTCNSGIRLYWAKDAKQAMQLLGYSEECVLFTIVKIDLRDMPVQYGYRD